ncbi:MAG: nuclear transport factor 2 family protein [Akkermansiaceae bacterium]|nr:nuclear transport factor 2 family protein [Akkermansiaceae bacterium]
MKFPLTSLVGVMLVSSSPSQANEQKSMEPEHFVISYEKALATQEWGKVAPLIHPDCTVTFSNGSCHKGKTEVQAAFQRNFDAIENEKYSITELHWVIRNKDFAVFTYSFAWSGVIAGEQASGAGRGTSTIVRGNTSWQLVSEHLGPQA